MSRVLTGALGVLLSFSIVEIDVARDFSVAPGPREIVDGEYSGEEFRINFLEPPLEAGKSIVVNLEGCAGLTTSFLDESFGGVVRRFGPEIVDRITFISPSRPHRVALAERYTQRAVDESRKG